MRACGGIVCLVYMCCAFCEETLYLCAIREMAPPIHLGAWSMALMLWLPFEVCLVKGSVCLYNIL